MKKKTLLILSILASAPLLFAEGSYNGRESLQLKSFLLLESPRQERSHLDLSPATPGARSYSGGALPSEIKTSPKMYTFKTSFRVDPALKGVDVSLYMGLSEYPFRLYLNGVELFSKGRYQEGHYNSSLRTVDAILLSPDLLHYGEAGNELVLEAFPNYETWGLDKIYVDRRESVDRAVFLRNFVGVNLIQGAFVLALVIGLYFFALYITERRRTVKNLFFSLICVSFCLAYFSVTTHFDANDEALMEALSKGGLVLMASFWLAFCCEFTSVLNKKRILPLVAIALSAVAAGLVMTRTDKAEILAWFGYAMNFIIVPELLLAFAVLWYALLRKGNRYVIPELLSYAVIIYTAANDVVSLNKSTLPYAWLTAYGYLATVIASFGTLVKEQADLYHRSLQQTADLIVNQQRIEILNEELTLQKNSFYRFVPTQFLEFLGRDSAVDIQLGDSSLRNLSILFSDIRQFTSLSERMLPEENFEFLNSYLNRMEGAINRNAGFVDKYIGDAIMALFADPDTDSTKESSSTAEKSLVAALEMHRELGEFNDRMAEKGFMALEIGIGINTGDVMMGTVGSQSRLDTTVIGDAVNLSSRLEGLTKFYKTPTLVSEQTVHNLASPEKFSFRLVDNVTVRGRTKPLMIYELLDEELDHGSGKISYAKDMDLAMTLYFSRDFEGAGRMFKDIHSENRGDFLPRLFAERCAAYAKAPPPEDWDGVFRFSAANRVTSD
jgi:Adenylate cyclase, family 3 (some proteins contain HAMP domain)